MVATSPHPAPLSALPPEVKARVEQLDTAWAFKVRPRPTTPQGNRLDLPKYDLIFLSDTPAPSSVRMLFERLLLVPWPLGLVVSIGVVVAARSGPVSTVWWLLAGALVVAGAVGLGMRSAFHYRRGRQTMYGLILAPEGMIRIDGFEQYRFVPRAEIQSTGVTAGGVTVTLANGAPAVVAGASLAQQRVRLIDDWLSPGGVVYTAPGFASGSQMPIGRVFGAIAAVAVVAGFLFAVLVYPGRSQAGTNATQFFSALRQKNFEQARSMLTKDAQQGMSLEAFKKALPREFMAQEGVSINGVAQVHGSNDEVRGCVDGWLSVPGQTRSPRFRLVFQSQGDSWGIMRLRTEHCGRSAWLPDMQSPR